MPVAPKVSVKRKEIKKASAGSRKAGGIKPKPGITPSAQTNLVIQSHETKADKFNQVFKWIISGATEHDIGESIANTFPGDDPSILLMGGIALIREVSRLDPALVIGFCFESTKDIYRRAAEMNDFPSALRALRQLRDLLPS